MVNDIYKLQDSNRALLNWVLDVRSLNLDLEGEHRPIELCQHISICYRNLTLPSDSNSLKTINPVDIDLKSYTSNDSEYRQTIKDFYYFLNSELYDYVRGVYLIGSLATLDYKKGWSDLDVIMIVKDSVVENGKKLSKLRALCFKAWDNFFLKITKLQHHGFIVMVEKDLLSYSERYMPTIVFDKSLSLLKNSQPLEFNIRPSSINFITALEYRSNLLKQAILFGEYKHHPKNGKYLKSNFSDSKDNMYQFFCFANYVMMLPSLFMSAIGSSCYKKDSFVLAKKYFTDESWYIVEKMTIVRNLWEEKEGLNYCSNSIPEWIMDIVGVTYLEETSALLDEAINIISSNKVQD